MMTSPAPTLIPERPLTTAVSWYFNGGGAAWGFERRHWVRLCRQLLDRLEPMARSGKGTLSCAELVRGTAVEHHEAWRHVLTNLLDILVKACVDVDLPNITALVVVQETGLPTRGFFEAARRYGRKHLNEADDAYWGRELERVHHRWSRTPRPTRTRR